MARSLGTSKAGFYWYFESRRRFEAELFEHWRAEETKRIIAEGYGPTQVPYELTA